MQEGYPPCYFVCAFRRCGSLACIPQRMIPCAPAARMSARRLRLLTLQQLLIAITAPFPQPLCPVMLRCLRMPWCGRRSVERTVNSAHKVYGQHGGHIRHGEAVPLCSAAHRVPSFWRVVARAQSRGVASGSSCTAGRAVAPGKAVSLSVLHALRSWGRTSRRQRSCCATWRDGDTQQPSHSDHCCGAPQSSAVSDADQYTVQKLHQNRTT